MTGEREGRDDATQKRSRDLNRGFDRKRPHSFSRPYVDGWWSPRLRSAPSGALVGGAPGDSGRADPRRDAVRARPRCFKRESKRRDAVRALKGGTEKPPAEGGPAPGCATRIDHAMA